MTDSTPNHITHGYPEATVTFTSSVSSGANPRSSLLRVCRFFNLLCEGVVRELGEIIIILTTITLLCGALLGILFGLAHLIHEIVAPSEKVDDIAIQIALSLTPLGIIGLVGYLTFDLIRSVWQKSAKG